MLNFSIILKKKYIIPKLKSKNQNNYLMKKFLAAVLFVTLSSFSLISSTEWTTYTWEQYKLAVTVPDYLRIKKNADGEFSLKGRGMELTIFVTKEKLTRDEMHDFVIKTANDYKMEEIDAEHEIEGDGLEGYYVEGFLDGKREIIAGMIQQKGRTNFAMYITFDDKDKQAEEDANEILAKITSTR